ncbi:MAG: hypothetical protein IJY15_09765, partial [Thermoguttaceae bacterium]|nr:hypothetical protein [Thermoguttaceae bacterium]
MKRAQNNRPSRPSFAARLGVFFLGSAFVFSAPSPTSAPTPNLTQSGGVAILRGGAIRGVVSNPEAGASEPIHIEPTLGGKISIDASLVRVGRLTDVSHCPLSAQVRKRLRRFDINTDDVRCVYSPEPIRDRMRAATSGSDGL